MKKMILINNQSFFKKYLVDIKQMLYDWTIITIIGLTIKAIIALSLGNTYINL